MMNKVYFTLIFILLFCSSCSYRQIYDGIQSSQQNDCLKIPGSEYEQCMEQANKPYDVYKNEREDILNKE